MKRIGMLMAMLLLCATAQAGQTPQVPTYYGKEGLERERIDIIKSKRWPKDVEAAILAGSVRLGMTQEMVRLAIGEPTRVTSTVSVLGTLDSWWYGNTDALLTFTNGRLTIVTKDR